MPAGSRASLSQVDCSARDPVSSQAGTGAGGGARFESAAANCVTAAGLWSGNGSIHSDFWMLVQVQAAVHAASTRPPDVRWQQSRAAEEAAALAALRAGRVKDAAAALAVDSDSSAPPSPQRSQAAFPGMGGIPRRCLLLPASHTKRQGLPF